MPPVLHHVGFAVASIAAVLDGLAQAIGADSDSQIYEDPLQRVRVAFVRSAAGASIELVEPLGEKSPIASLLARGGGLYHVCYEVDDLDRQLEIACAAGATRLRPPRPAAAFAGRRIAWVITKQKLLIEYLEREARP